MFCLLWSKHEQAFSIVFFYYFDNITISYHKSWKIINFQKFLLIHFWYYNFQEQLARERTVSGRIQIQVWYHDERKELVVAVLAADDLAPRDESLGFGNLPEAYARLCLMPLTYVSLSSFNRCFFIFILTSFLLLSLYFFSFQSMFHVFLFLS